MASDYTLMIEAQLNPDKISAQIKAITEKHTIHLKAELDASGVDKFNQEMEKIRAKAKDIGKISFVKDDMGNVTRAVVDYTDKMNNAVKTTIMLGESLSTAEKISANLGKNSKELERAALNAEKFLEKAKGLQQTPQVTKASDLAKQINQAVSEGNLDKVRELNRQFEVAKASISSAGSALRSWSTGLKDAIVTTAQYALSIGLVRGALNQIREGIQYITELNTEMTKIQVLQIDGAKTNEQISDLALQYNNLAKQLGTTTVEVAKGSVEWLRQGKSIEQTQELLRSTMYLSKLGNLDAAQSTEYLTAILNGFQMEASEAEAVVNKLVAIDNIAATSAGELATAMQYSSAIANETGISFENLAAMIGAVSSNTRLSAEMIGQAFKTMAVRMQSVKAGAIDETGMSLNNVEKTLSNVGISLRDSADSFRPLEDVIADVAVKWKDLNEVQRAQISNAIAGQRQAQIFTSLMQNWGDVTKFVTAETESLGLAQKNYAIYLESIEAKQNSLRASWEKLVSGAATAEFVGSFYEGATWILDTVDALGGIPTILKVLIPLLIAFNLEWLTTQRLALASSFKGIISVLGTLGTTLKVAVNPALLQTAVAEGAVATGLDAIAVSQAAVTLGLTLLIALLVKAYQDFKELRKAQEESRDSAAQTSEQIAKEAGTYEEYVSRTTEALKAQGLQVDENGRAYGKGAHNLRDYNSGISLMSESLWEASQTTDQFDRTQATLNETIQETTDWVEEANQSYQSLAETMQGMTDAQDSLQGIMDKAESGQLDFSDIDALAKIYPDYLNALTVENGQLKLNTDMVREYIAAKADQAVADAIAAGASEQEIAILQAYADQLREQQNVMIAGMNLTTQTANQVFWNIANEAALSGNSFVDLQGKALTSADAIYKFLASGDQAFNSFVQQAAQMTGKSVADIMAMVNNMVVNSANNAIQAVNAVAAATNGMAYSQGAVATTAAYVNKPSSVGSLGLFTPAPAVSLGGGGGSGGSGAPKKSKKDKKAEQQKKVDDQIAKAQKDAEESLKKQLDTYKDVLDVRKKILDSLVEERNYQRDLEDKNAEILRIQNELAVLSLDDSAESRARQLELQEELTKAQRDLEDMQYEHSVDEQKKALDADYAAFEDRVNAAIDAIKGINAKTVADFTAQLSTILSGIGTVPSFHSGANSGVVGSQSTGGLKSNEMFAKLMAGEVVVNEDQAQNFFKRVVPQLASSESVGNTSGGISIEMPINVQGSLDKNVLPDLERMVTRVVDKINQATLSRGINRRADLFGYQ